MNVKWKENFTKAEIITELERFRDRYFPDTKSDYETRLERAVVDDVIFHVKLMGFVAEEESA